MILNWTFNGHRKILHQVQVENTYLRLSKCGKTKPVGQAF